ncbi:hypothetical protein B9Q11_01285 [Candidatus Marsarchaeota G2 archaeon ECH_B_SAG-F08]|jgi:hypothetical protein|uniref:Uncharacterized protein n=2 Tax=Candidatus Marsarchaeota group 2 TaxID=2203771 RepID=A0A2R6BKB9_9ARCH|nr:MAG: hypothetical protein B9Q11_01285 [Candidatus Marsarchaeota G2 archaeon ECH_B_SAG-F08]
MTFLKKREYKMSNCGRFGFFLFTPNVMASTSKHFHKGETIQSTEYFDNGTIVYNASVIVGSDPITIGGGVSSSLILYVYNTTCNEGNGVIYEFVNNGDSAQDAIILRSGSSPGFEEYYFGDAFWPTYIGPEYNSGPLTNNNPYPSGTTEVDIGFVNTQDVWVGAFVFKVPAQGWVSATECGFGSGTAIDIAFYLVNTQTNGEYSLGHPAGYSGSNPIPNNTVYSELELFNAPNAPSAIPSEAVPAYVSQA